MSDAFLQNYNLRTYCDHASTLDQITNLLKRQGLKSFQQLKLN